MMIAQAYTVRQMTKMFRPNELAVVPITSKKEVDYPREYLLYGDVINRYSWALTALRDMCDEVFRRKRNGIVFPHVIITVEDVQSLLLRCRDGEIANLLDILRTSGTDSGIELVM